MSQLHTKSKTQGLSVNIRSEETHLVTSLSQIQSTRGNKIPLFINDINIVAKIDIYNIYPFTFECLILSANVRSIIRL